MSLRANNSRRAELDLAFQYRWYAKQAGVEIAERYLAAFDAEIHRLCEQPGIGRARYFRIPELAGMRSKSLPHPFDAHLIFYRADGNLLSIERVLHGARDLPRRLLELPSE